MSAGLDPNLPVLVGVGQVSQRVDRGDQVLEPADLMAEALRRAGADSGSPSLLRDADSIRAIGGVSWRYRDPAAAVAQRIGAHPRETTTSVIGGNMVQSVVNATAMDIQMGRADIVLITGAEAWWTAGRARRSGTTPNWSTQPEATRPSRVYGTRTAFDTPAEAAAGVHMPLDVYPLIDIALRAAERRDPDEHRAHIAGLWSRFSHVAAGNPHAWIQQSFTPEEIATVSPDNRMVTYPYTKRLASNNDVEQGAALVLCSAKTARSLGIAAERWVFPHSGADADDTPFLSNRLDLRSSPAMRIAGRMAMDLAGVTPDEVDHIDLYSCFPSAVQVAAAELGLESGRSLTVTGGMAFAGGPWNSYALHAIATMADVLRDDPGAVGMCTGNGGYLTKHSFGLYSTDPPPARRYRHARPQGDVDAMPCREADDAYLGPVTVESYAVVYDRSGAPERAVVPALTPDGRRTWGATTDPATLGALVTSEQVGAAAHRDHEGTIDLI